MPKRNRGAALQWRDDRQCFEIQWYEGGRRRRRSTGTADRGEAETALGDFLHRRDRERPGPRDPSEILIADLLADYAEAREHRVSADRIAYAIAPLVRYWSGRTAADVSESTCRAYGEWRERAPGTVRKELSVLASAINLAFRRGRITRPVHVELPAKVPTRDRYLSRQEVARLIRAARTDINGRRNPKWRHLVTFIMLALYTGGRKGAVLGLRWPAIDLERARIDLNDPTRSATAKGRAVVPIARPLLLYLRAARRHGSATGFVVSYQGRPVANIRHAFENAVERAGLGPDVTPHVLRHTCATWLASRGVPLFDVAGFLGHRDLRTTERYAKHDPAFLGRARSALERPA